MMTPLQLYTYSTPNGHKASMMPARLVDRYAVAGDRAAVKRGLLMPEVHRHAAYD